MNLLIKRVLLLTIIGTLFASCGEEDNELISERKSSETATKSKQFNNKNGESITYISETIFDEEFNSFAEAFFSEHSEGLIDIEHLPASLEYKLTTFEVGPIDPISDARIICRGAHSNVVACMERHKHKNGAIGFAGCEYYWLEIPFAGGNGSVWEAHVDC